MSYIASLRSEINKIKRSNVFWFCLIAGLFVPGIRFIAALVTGHHMNEEGAPGWVELITGTFRNMGNFLLPMIVVLAASMITQLEVKNNAWKQVHASPQSYVMIYLSKLTLLFMVLAAFLVFFMFCILLSFGFSTLLLDGALPNDSLPWRTIIDLLAQYFWICSPIVFFQYALSILFKNFLAAVGIGLLGLIGSLLALSWTYKWTIPFTFTIHSSFALPTPDNFHWYVILHILVLGIVGFVLYTTKKDKG